MEQAQSILVLSQLIFHAGQDDLQLSGWCENKTRGTIHVEVTSIIQVTSAWMTYFPSLVHWKNKKGKTHCINVNESSYTGWLIRILKFHSCKMTCWMKVPLLLIYHLLISTDLFQLILFLDQMELPLPMSLFSHCTLKRRWPHRSLCKRFPPSFSLMITLP